MATAFDAEEHPVVDGGRDSDAEFNLLGDYSSTLTGLAFDEAEAAADGAEARIHRLNSVETLLAARADVLVSDLTEL